MGLTRRNSSSVIVGDGRLRVWYESLFSSLRSLERFEWVNSFLMAFVSRVLVVMA